MKEIAKKIRQFFYLTPRDLGMQISSVDEIAEKMKKVDKVDGPLPYEFASTMRRILSQNTTRTL